MPRLSEKARIRESQRAVLERRAAERKLAQHITRCRLQGRAVQQGGTALDDPFASHFGGLVVELMDILREPSRIARRQRLSVMDSLLEGL